MQSTTVLVAFFVPLYAVLCSPTSNGIPLYRDEDLDELDHSDISIAYMNWIRERGALFSSTPPPTAIPAGTTAPEREVVFRIPNASDLLSRYHETERKQRGKAIEPFFNTPALETTTSIIPPPQPPSSANSPANAATMSDEQPYDRASSVVIIILTIVVSSVTIGGNILVLAAFYVERTLRMPTNYFIASLAVTDVLIGIFSMNLYSLYLLLGYWPLGRLLCDLWLGLDYTLCLTSQYTVFFITLDRFFSVRIPAKYRNWRTGNKVLAMIAITWILPSSIFFTTILGWPYFSKHNHVRKSGDCYAEFSSNPMFNTILTISYFWVTLTVMTGLYIGIYLVALRLQKRSEIKKIKVQNFLSMSHQVTSGKSAGSTAIETEVDFGESCHLPSSNETGVKITSGEFGSSALPPHDNNYGIKITPRRPTEDFMKPIMPYCGPLSPRRESTKANTSALTVDTRPKAEYTNDCFSDANLCLQDKDFEKASPTSVVETPFVGIRSPQLNDPEIGDATTTLDVTFHSFPSSPAVNVFSDMEASLSSENGGSSLQLSFACSQEFGRQSFNSSTGGPPSIFGQKEEGPENIAYSTRNYECTPLRNSATNPPQPSENAPSNQEASDDCPFVPSHSSVPNADTRRISKATAARVAQIWQNRLLMAAENRTNQTKNHKSNHENKYNMLTEKSKTAGTDTTDSHGTSTSRNLLKVGKKKVLNNYFQRPHDSSANSSRQAPMERGRTANRARKALKTISLILGAFVLCWTPYHIVILIKGFCDDPGEAYTCVNRHFYSVTYWMCYINSPINPFCYALANAQFKQAFLRILRMDLRRR